MGVAFKRIFVCRLIAWRPEIIEVGEVDWERYCGRNNIPIIISLERTVRGRMERKEVVSPRRTFPSIHPFDLFPSTPFAQADSILFWVTTHILCHGHHPTIRLWPKTLKVMMSLLLILLSLGHHHIRKEERGGGGTKKGQICEATRERPLPVGITATDTPLSLVHQSEESGSQGKIKWIRQRPYWQEKPTEGNINKLGEN